MIETNPKTKIRKSAKNDAPKIAAFLRRNFKNHNLQFSTSYVMQSMKKGIWFKAMQTNQIIGLVFIEIIKQDKRAELKHLIVQKKFRNKGIGIGLLQNSIKLARDKNLRKISGIVSSKNVKPLKKLALKFNFKMEGMLKNHYRENEDAYIYSIFLNKKWN